MVPKIHAKGHSFLGVHRYLIHDKDAETSHRVAWTENINLGTSNPAVAARVMAATAMDSARLKAEAGVKNTGRKSNAHVLHATLSWHADEREDLTKEDMIRAAKWFLEKLGAEDRQAVLYSHNDEPHPHIHLVVNRVSPKDGRMLPSSLERIKASEWAEKYERDRGKIYCDQRVINNKARKRGEYVRGEKDEPRHFHEMRQQAGNDNNLKAKVEVEIDKMRKAYHKKKQAERDHRLSIEDAKALHLERLRLLREGLQRRITIARSEVQKSFADEWHQEYYEQDAQRSAFLIQENSLLGRVSNALGMVDWKALMRMQKGHPDGRAGRLGEAFNIFGSSGARARALIKQQALRENEIKRRQNLAEANAIVEVRRKVNAEIMAAVTDYRNQIEVMENRRRVQQQTFDAEIRAANRLRRKSWKRFLDAKRVRDQETRARSPANDNRPEKSTSQDAPQSPQTLGHGVSDAKPPEAVTGEARRPKTKASDLLPKQGADEAAKIIDQHEDRKARIKAMLAAKKAAAEEAKKNHGKGGGRGGV